MTTSRYLNLPALISAFMLTALPAAAGDVLVDDASYPEGPLWLADSLYFAEMGRDRVTVMGTGEPKVWWREEGCGPTSIAAYREGELLVLCHLARKLVRLSRDGNPLGAIEEDERGKKFQDPNDATSDGSGGVFFSDSGLFHALAPATGVIFHLDREGRVRRLAQGLRYANGVHYGAGALFVSEHLARRVLRYPVLRNPEIALGSPETVFEFPRRAAIAYPEAGPDGLELDAQGRLWVALYGEGRLAAIDLAQKRARFLPVAMPFVTSIAFSPQGELAITGPFENALSPYRGQVWLIPADKIESRLLPE